MTVAEWRRMGGRVLLLLFTVLCSVLFVETAVDIESKRAKIRKLTQCRGKNNLAMVWYDSQIGYTDNATTISIKVRVKEVIDDLYILLSFWKCDASGNLDTCEIVVDAYNVSNTCEVMAAKNEAWTLFIEHFDKPPLCPIKPGEYYMRACPINTDFMKYLPIDDAVWKMKLLGYVGNKLISCVELEEQVVTVYQKKNKKRVG